MKNFIFLFFLIFLSCNFSHKRPVLAFVTDFSSKSDAIGICQGVVATIYPKIQTINLNNDITPFNIYHASYTLTRSSKYFPSNTVFVVVVDPGVGTKRGPVAIKTNAELYYIAPDNGVLSGVIKQQGIKEAFLLDEKKINPAWERGTFDGRDLFAPAGALLLKNRWKLEKIGTPIKKEELVVFEDTLPKMDEEQKIISGKYVLTDVPYGNVWTNISKKELDKITVRNGDLIELSVNDNVITLPFSLTFGEVKEGEDVAYLNSDGYLAFAVNMGNFAEKYFLKPGIDLQVKRIEKR